MHLRNILLRSMPTLVTLLVAILAIFPVSAMGLPFVSGADAGSNELIVRFAPQAEFNVAAQSVAHLRAGATRIRGLRGMPGYDLVTVPRGSSAEQVMRRYHADPSVLYAEPDYPVSITTVPDDPRFGEQWALENTGQSGGTPGADIKAPDAWTVTTGGPDVLVAVIDTGVDYEHPDLAPNMWSGLGWNFAEDNADPMDIHGHGTHVAGTIAAVGNDGFGVAGVAWEARIMALKALGDDGSGRTSDIAEAVTYASANGADIINMSLGGGSYSQAFYDAIAASDALVVCAAGNEGSNNDSSPSYPASYDLENIVAVAATDRTDTLASWSNYGATSVDLGAPGVAILSTVPGATYTATTVFSDPFDTLGAWNTSYYEFNPWTLSSTRYASPLHSAGHVPLDGYLAGEESWIYTRDYVSLTEADRIAVRFKARLDTVSSDDWLVLVAKPQGALIWTVLAVIGGATGEFRNYGLQTTSLTGTRAQFAFILDSVYSGGPGSGVWVDDVEIDSLVRDGGVDYSDAHGYKSGTSMAAPHVAGVAALLKAHAPALDSAGLKSAILDTVEPLDTLDGKTLTGGRLDAAA
ncbi:MAG: S8 family serine peptidase, partial [Coriobacteriia bacterium]|nr:S8 family serine peptidase [Coriobacteriia bacterium]